MQSVFQLIQSPREKKNIKGNLNAEETFVNELGSKLETYIIYIFVFFIFHNHHHTLNVQMFILHLYIFSISAAQT